MPDEDQRDKNGKITCHLPDEPDFSLSDQITKALNIDQNKGTLRSTIKEKHIRMSTGEAFIK